MRRILDLVIHPSPSGSAASHRTIVQANAVIGEMNALDPRVESVWADLQSWRASLPKHLHFYETAQDNGSGNMSLCTWQARQQSSLRIRE